MAEQERSPLAASQAPAEVAGSTEADAREAREATSEETPEAGTGAPQAQQSPSSTAPRRGKRTNTGGGTAPRPRKTKQPSQPQDAAIESGAATPANGRKKGTRAQARKTEGTAEAGEAAGESPKKAARAKKATAGKPGPGASKPRTRKKSTPPAEPVEPVELPGTVAPATPIAQELPVEPATPLVRSVRTEALEPAEDARGVESEAAERAFEPDLDVTPVKPRTTIAAERREERRTDLFSDLETGEALAQVEMEAALPSEAEVTLKRPAIEAGPAEESPAAQAVAGANEPPVAWPEAEPDISPFELEPAPEPEPDAFVGQAPGQPAGSATLAVAEHPDLLEVAETPLPGFDVAEYPGLAEVPYTPLPGVESAESTELPPALPETPLPTGIEEQFIPLTPPLPLLEEERPAALKVPPAPEVKALPRPAPAPRLSKGRAALVLLLLFALSFTALWRDVSDTHLYLYSVDPLNGQVQAQQDLGGGYSSITTLTGPVQSSPSSLLVGLSTSPATQGGSAASEVAPASILTLSGESGSAAWSVAHQINAPLSHASLSVTPGHQFVVASAGSVQVLTQDGQRLWQAQLKAPARGAHAFAPAFDETTLYTVKDASSGMLAAYDLLSGALRWSQRLGDTQDYAPPLLLSGNTLFVAGDHTLYALDRSDGRVLWNAAAPVRTLLLDTSGQQPRLVAAGAGGLLAFDAQSGRVAWAFDGHPHTDAGVGARLSSAQFYQASLSASGQVVYASGIVWDERQAREQLWLYAVDAQTGAARWSEQVGSDFASADAGRVFSPFVDAAQGLVMLETASADGSHHLSAYNAGNGSLRWNLRLAGVTASAPTLFQAANSRISFFSVQEDPGTALHGGWAWQRLLLVILCSASLLLLLGLWLLPLASWQRRTLVGLRAPWRGLRALARQIAAWWRHSRRARVVVTGCLVALVVSAGVITSISISRPQQYLNAVEASSGSTQWQQALDTPSTLSGAGEQDSFVVMKAGPGLSVLSALANGGSRSSPRWSMPASEGSYTLPPVQSAPGTLLVALRGPTSLPYTYAPDDLAYPHPIAHLLVLSLLDIETGRVLWQSTVVPPGEAQESVVLGADARYTYIASRSIPQAGQATQAAVVQLIAVDTSSGAIAWHVYGSREDGATAPDFGALLPQGNLLYWQVANAVYALDTPIGQIEWRMPIAEVNSASALLEESQMALSEGVLLVRRSDQYHALDPATGTQLWSVQGLGSATTYSPGGVLATRGEFILYGNGVIEALNASSRAVIWHHDSTATIAEATMAPGGSLVYAVVLDGAQDGTMAVAAAGPGASAQALVAFDVQEGAVRWTFQPGGQGLFTYPGAPELHTARGMLYVTLCMSPSSATHAGAGSSPCGSQVLYGLNATNGNVAWKFAAGQVSAVQVSQDGSAVVFQTSSSLWDNLKARLQG